MTLLGVEEAALILGLLGKHQSTWVYGVVYGIFNPLEAISADTEKVDSSPLHKFSL